MTVREVRVRAFAKINLDLRVLRKRPDGYHELRTIFQTISLADRLKISYRPAGESTIRVTGNVEIEDNLVARAARMMLEELGVGGVVGMELEKRIPMGAGLGGGSSDAAAVLLALPVLVGRGIAPGRLAGMAARLGSDVPFFLYGGTAMGLGRGEELYPLPDQPRRRGLLVAPDVHVSTAEAYGRLSQHLNEEAVSRKLEELAEVAWSGDLTRAANDFEAPVFGQHPRLAGLRRTLAEYGGEGARMSGSGSSVFALFRTAGDRARAGKALLGQPALPLVFVGRAAYRQAWARALQPFAEAGTWPPAPCPRGEFRQPAGIPV